MEFNFSNLIFIIRDNKIRLINYGDLLAVNKDFSKIRNFVEVQVAGENKDSHFGNKMICSSEGGRLNYVSHSCFDDMLIVVQRSELIEVKTTFKSFAGTNSICVFNQIKNISKKAICLEEASSFVLNGICGGIQNTEKSFFYKFTQCHHGECQPRKFSLFDLGLFLTRTTSQKRIFGCNVGSWSTKEELPQGIFEYDNRYLMFQIESNTSWYYEISDTDEQLYLYLGAANTSFCAWSKKLKTNETYTTIPVSICFGETMDSVLAEMTKYRRIICGKSNPDMRLPTIFNEYMHLSWDSPTEENTRLIAPTIAKLGVEYYVIDCGWHNEEKGTEVYPYIGQWKESKARFPNGVKKTTDFIRSLGMKAGLWIEPEVIGIYCKDMLAYYDDDCFLQRNGKRLAVMGRHFLDFRAKKVVEYMTETIRRMVEDYGAEYIKFDYNQDCGVGTDYLSYCAGEGLERCAKAYLEWVDMIREKFPNVLFETCSSGGMRMDYETLKHFSIVSTSDQTDYKKYPYIAGNILSAALPEQAAVWSYPVDTKEEIGKVYTPTTKWVDENISNEQIIMNMINSFLGRMHLASHIELLSEEKQELIKEGIEYYNFLATFKKNALPVFPLGFTDFSKQNIASGFISGKTIFLAVWNLDNIEPLVIPFGEELNIENVLVGYPKKNDVEYFIEDNTLTINFKEKYTARFFEIKLKE